MIQDIFPYKLNNQYDAFAVPEDEDFVIAMKDGEMLVNSLAIENMELQLPQVSLMGKGEDCRYLFSIDDERYFLLQNPEIVPENYHYMNLRDIRHSKAMPKYRIFAALTAKHLADWYKDAMFCGRCGKRMMHSKKERAMECPSCGYTAYPRIMPAVIVGVTYKEKLLLTKYRTGYGHNALVAGFTEIGETLEETVQREVMEETGLKVKNIRYYKSQPWGIANDILMGFYCDVDGDPTIQMDEQELKYAQWVKREDIILQPDDFSLTNEMMMKFKNKRELQ